MRWFLVALLALTSCKRRAGGVIDHDATGVSAHKPDELLAGNPCDDGTSGNMIRETGAMGRADAERAERYRRGDPAAAPVQSEPSIVRVPCPDAGVLSPQDAATVR